ncbi:hypothetical protein D3C84_650950 [compost metagenome]
MRCWVTTLTDCGVSRSDMLNGVAVRAAAVVYEFVSSVTALRSRTAVSVTAIGAKVRELPVSVCSVFSAACTHGAAKAIPAASMCTARARGRTASCARGGTVFCEHREIGLYMRTHIWFVLLIINIIRKRE